MICAAAAGGSDHQPQAGATTLSRGRSRHATPEAQAGRWGWARSSRPSHPAKPQWGVDFISDALAWGRRIRLFTVVDVFTREALAIAVDTSLPGGRVVRVLERVAAERGVPEEIVPDRGPELAGKALDQ